MSFESDFLELMVDTLTYEHETGTRDGYAKATGFGAPVTVTCRIVHSTRMVRADTGEEIVSRSHAYLAGAPGIRVNDRITMPDGSQPPVVAVERFPDTDGPHHEVVYFGSVGGGIGPAGRVA